MAGNAPQAQRLNELEKLVLGFVRPQERGLSREQQLNIGSQRLRKTTGAVNILQKKLGYNRKESAQLLVGVARMRRGEIGPMSMPGGALIRADKALREFTAGMQVEPVKSESSRLRRRANLPPAPSRGKMPPTPRPTPTGG